MSGGGKSDKRDEAGFEFYDGSGAEEAVRRAVAPAGGAMLSAWMVGELVEQFRSAVEDWGANSRDARGGAMREPGADNALTEEPAEYDAGAKRGSNDKDEAITRILQNEWLRQLTEACLRSKDASKDASYEPARTGELLVDLAGSRALQHDYAMFIEHATQVFRDAARSGPPHDASSEFRGGGESAFALLDALTKDAAGGDGASASGRDAIDDTGDEGLSPEAVEFFRTGGGPYPEFLEDLLEYCRARPDEYVVTDSAAQALRKRKADPFVDPESLWKRLLGD